MVFIRFRRPHLNKDINNKICYSIYEINNISNNKYVSDPKCK